MSTRARNENTRGHNYSACVVCHKSPFKDQGISFHRFPCNLRIRLLWLKACNMTKSDYQSSYRLCSNHFSKICFKTNCSRRSLKTGSVPTIFTNEEHEPSSDEKQSSNKKELSDEEKIQFCPPSMERYDKTIIQSSTIWICKRCTAVVFSEDAVLRHVKIPCKPKNIAGLNHYLDDDNLEVDGDNEGNNEDHDEGNKENDDGGNDNEENDDEDNDVDGDEDSDEDYCVEDEDEDDEDYEDDDNM